MVTDPIADMLTRIRNALLARHDFTLSAFLEDEARHCQDPEGRRVLSMINEVLKGKPQRVIKVHLKYTDKKEPVLTGLKRVSKPGLRIYVLAEGDPPGLWWSWHSHSLYTQGE